MQSKRCKDSTDFYAHLTVEKKEIISRKDWFLFWECIKIKLCFMNGLVVTKTVYKQKNTKQTPNPNSPIDAKEGDNINIGIANDCKALRFFQNITLMNNLNSNYQRGYI